MGEHPGIIVLGYSEAGMLLRAHETHSIAAVLTICGHREYAIDATGIPHVLSLHFDDVEALDSDPIQAARQRLRSRKLEEIGIRQTPPTLEHARGIIEFARTLITMRGVLLCQCQGGVSRSPAAALLCLATWKGAGSEEVCAERLLAIRPCAVPHRNLVAFGDELLDRRGALLAAADRVFSPPGG